MSRQQGGGVWPVQEAAARLTRGSEPHGVSREVVGEDDGPHRRLARPALQERERSMQPWTGVSGREKKAVILKAERSSQQTALTLPMSSTFRFMLRLDIAVRQQSQRVGVIAATSAAGRHVDASDDEMVSWGDGEIDAVAATAFLHSLIPVTVRPSHTSRLAARAGRPASTVQGGLTSSPSSKLCLHLVELCTPAPPFLRLLQSGLQHAASASTPSRITPPPSAPRLASACSSCCAVLWSGCFPSLRRPASVHPPFSLSSSTSQSSSSPSWRRKIRPPSWRPS